MSDRIAKIRGFLKTLDVHNPKHANAQDRALLAVYNNQTSDEKTRADTLYNNGQGFNGRDAQFCTSLVSSLNQYGSLTPRQREALKKVLPKYARQVVEAYPEA